MLQALGKGRISSFSCNDSMNASSSIIGCASSEPSPAAELIAVNTDLLTEILVCLPATSLLRFKSVSKHWLSLISDSRFALRHAARNPRPSALGLFLRLSAVPGKPAYISLRGHLNPPSLDFLDGIVGPVRSFPKISHSSNGLLLCEYPCRIAPHAFTSRYLVCNPTTRSYRLLPSRILPRMVRGFLAFDPSKSPHYKVVVMCIYPSVEIHIYFSESSSWKKFQPRKAYVRHVVLCSGVIYWICEGNRMGILGFDIDSEKMLELPNTPAVLSNIYLYFGEIAGRLTLIERISPSAVAFKILEMDKDHWHWIVKFQVNLEPLFSVFRELEDRVDRHSLLHIVEGQKGKIFGLVLAIQGKVICYNLKSETWNVLCDPCRYPCGTYPFVPSLFPL